MQRFGADGDVAVGLDLTDGFDITDPAQCVTAADRIVAEHGRIDVLCNNAGISAVGDDPLPAKRWVEKCIDRGCGGL